MKDSNGRAGYTGSPSESTCTACHGGGSGTTMVNVSFNPAIPSGSYTPNQTYTVTVTVSNNAYSKFGFGCEILNVSTNANIGTMPSAGTGVTFKTAGNGRKNAVHSTPKSGTGSASFSFVWTAPSTGNAVLYAIGNAVNGNGSTSGDKVSSTYSLSLVPDVTGVALNESHIQNLVVFPNPIKDYVNVQFSASTSLNNVSFSIIDLNGKTVFEKKMTSVATGLNNIQFSIPENISNGLYILHTSAENISLKKMIIIQK
ncbi:MAG TPA: T9SS type A sorting domain-containing protein [Bacteroidia bacterium]|nr:T9SS type A sorting domain-containing protein [Bacteroidia bacterium]